MDLAMMTFSFRDDLHDALDALVCTTERTLVNLIARPLELLGRPGDHVATAGVLCGQVDGAMRVHEHRERSWPDARFVDAVVEAVLHIVFPGGTAH